METWTLYSLISHRRARGRDVHAFVLESKQWHQAGLDQEFKIWWWNSAMIPSAHWTCVSLANFGDNPVGIFFSPWWARIWSTEGFSTWFRVTKLGGVELSTERVGQNHSALLPLGWKAGEDPPREAQSSPLLSVCPWANYLPSWCFRMFICKTDISNGTPALLGCKD